MATTTTAKTAAKKAKGTRGPNKVKTAAEVKALIAKKKAEIIELERLAYAGDLDEAIKKTNIVSDFKTIKANASGATELVILAAIGKAVGIARLEVSQKDAPKRKYTKKPNATQS